MKYLRKIHSLYQIALTALALVALSTASAEPPMWVVEDDDSTIYLFGTVHMLKPNQEWFTDRVRAAYDRADEVWFEVPLLESIEATQKRMGPIFMQAAYSPGKPLSSRLNATERDQLATAISRSGHPQQLSQAIENMKPWFAISQLAAGPLRASGYDAQHGIDVVLSRAAHQAGTPVRGLETFEQQIGYLSHGKEDEQLVALRTLLSIPEATVRLEKSVTDMAFTNWLEGDPELLGQIVAVWRQRPYPQEAPMPYDVLVKDRNADWAQQIATLLDSDGIIFIAVGAGHLVGPDGVIHMLSERGIEAKQI